MSNLPDQLRTAAGYLCAADSDLLTEAAAELDRLILLTGQPDIDQCDNVLRMRSELADARAAAATADGQVAVLRGQLSRCERRLAEVDAVVRQRLGVPPEPEPEDSDYDPREEFALED